MDNLKKNKLFDEIFSELLKKSLCQSAFTFLHENIEKLCALFDCENNELLQRAIFEGLKLEKTISILLNHSSTTQNEN